MRKKLCLVLGRTGVVLLSFLAVLLLSLVSGCARSSTPSRPTLHLSMIPTTDPGKIVRESQAFIDYLEREMGAKIELTVPTNYAAAVVEAVANDRVDIAYFGGFTYVQASARSGRTRGDDEHTVEGVVSKALPLPSAMSIPRLVT